jgi:DNA-binding LacI/PurR family transcriptional regulator
MATIRDIAKRARVSVGTISNYLNNPEVVAEETRQAIETVIKELQYHPRAAARSLKSRQTRRLGLVPLISIEDNHSLDPGDTAFLEFLSAVNTAAAENGYDILLSTATSTRSELKIYERLIGEIQVDGLILMGTRPDDQRVALLETHAFPFVSYGRTSNWQDHAFVDVDGAAGINLAVEHLHSLGHRRIAYIQPPDELMLSCQRWEGYCRAMADRDLKIIEEYVIPGGFNERAGQVAMHLLLDLPRPPTAVMAPNDLSAFGAMRALQVRGLTAGKDVSVVGFDDIKLASHWHPSLTTIAQPFRQIGFEVVKALISLIHDAQLKPRVYIEPRLVVRQSSGVAPPEG